MQWNEKAEHIMAERFRKDTVIPLAMVENGIPYVRNVNVYYEDGRQNDVWQLIVRTTGVND